MTLTESFSVPIGSSAHAFHLKGVDDRMHSLADYAGSKVLIVIFMCNHCPYVQAIIDRLISIQEEYSDRSVQLIGINSNDDLDYPKDDFEHMEIFSTEHAMNFPYLRDDTQEVARVYQAKCTPDIFVYDSERALRYHGRIDDCWKDEKRAVKNDLRDALDAILDGREVSKKQFPAMGCSIKWRNHV